MPGSGLVMDGAVQQAPQDGRHARGMDGDMGFQARRVRSRQYSKPAPVYRQSCVQRTMLTRLPDKVRRAGSPCTVMRPEPLARALTSLSTLTSMSPEPLLAR